MIHITFIEGARFGGGIEHQFSHEMPVVPRKGEYVYYNAIDWEVQDVIYTLNDSGSTDITIKVRS